jgi:hypothetical protein
MRELSLMGSEKTNLMVVFDDGILERLSSDFKSTLQHISKFFCLILKSNGCSEILSVT